ncbi:MAG TPA: tetratricopeptide repeat protein, partial [Candidatus Angelobacter sp.]|nr:tetratricopeptide repeat protein [Candidatus Angelobacter sp.]
MALGFGFNKVKVLAQAEKFVQQGKLPNAIAEYEKVIKEDPKDLTVLNTVGDLYVRMGSNEQAAYYFKRVGEQYALNGFTVKAIAIFKKLTKLSSFNAEIVTRLAELYSQQGLFNDARVHYMQVADQLLKSGDNNQAARIFQKILELDPENAHTQAKLADLYTKLGKRDEARNIYSSAAESLYARGSYAAADEALEKVLTLDPQNASALMLRGLIAVDAGNSEAAVGFLEGVPDLDSRADGLRALLRAKLQTGHPDGVEEVAEKLLANHNDSTGIITVAQWYATNGQLERALRLYEAHAERLFAGNQAALHETLNPLLSRAKDNPAALAIVNRLLKQAGDHGQTAEIIELQAHAAANKGNFAEARDLYQKLMEMEPENALHAQNHKQMQAKLGEDSATRILTPEEAAQAFMVEELDESAPPVQQKYDPPTEQAIESALTDAELYVSYNVPAKAIPPLEAALPLAPQDVNLNQRLAGLYVRAERYGDAAKLYKNLSDIYKELGHEAESAKYLEASKRYALRAPQTAAAATTPMAQPAAPARATWPPQAPPPVPEAQAEAAVEIGGEPSVQEFSFDAPDLVAEPAPIESIAPEPIVAEPVVSEIKIEPASAEPEPVALQAEASGHEIDISNEWEEMIEVEPVEIRAERADAPVEEAAAELAEVRLEPQAAPEAGAGLTAQIADKIQEIRFYISQEMWEPAKSAILDLTELAPDAPETTELIAEVSAGQSKASAAPPGAEATPIFIEEPAPPPAPAVAKGKPKIEGPAVPPAPTPAAPQVLEPLLPEQPALAAKHEDVLDIPAPAQSRPQPAAAASARSTEDILGDFVLDLEQSEELKDFVPKQHVEPKAAPAVAAAPAMAAKSNGELQEADAHN